MSKESDHSSLYPPVRIFRQVKPVQIGPISGDARLDEVDEIYLPYKSDLLPPGVTGIEGLCDADPKEIQARQDVIRFLTDDPAGVEMRQRVAGAYYSRGYKTLPKGESGEFLQYALDGIDKGKTWFWNIVDEFKQAMVGLDNAPARIRDLYELITNEGPMRIVGEQMLAENMVRDMRKAALCRGLQTFQLEVQYPHQVRNGCKPIGQSYGRSSVAGEYHYSAENDPSEVKHHSALRRWFNQTTLGQWWQRRRSTKASTITQIPDAITADLTRWLDGFIWKAAFVDGDTSRNTTEAWDALTHRCEAIKAEALIITVAFQFDTSGLHAEVVGTHIQSNPRCVVKVGSFPGWHNLVDGRLQERYHALGLNRYVDRLAGAFERLIFGQLQNWTDVGCPATDEKFSRGSFYNTYERFSEEITGALQWQDWLITAFKDIVTINYVASAMKLQAWYDGAGSYCWPEVIDSSDIATKGFGCSDLIEATGILPLRPIGDEDSVPKSFSSISMIGAIVNLTGRNGSGKSTLEMSVLDHTLYAQCGFWVPARSFRFTPKETILFSFLERATDESTVVRKFRVDKLIAEMINAMEGLESRMRTLVIIDEMGSATTQSSVIPICRKYMQFLRNARVAVLVSTQIPELSEILENELGAINLRINESYELVPGIGEGEPQEVAAACGLLDVIDC